MLGGGAVCCVLVRCVVCWCGVLGGGAVCWVVVQCVGCWCDVLGAGAVCWRQWRTQEFYSGGGFQQIQLRTEDKENGDLGAVDP